MSAPDINYLMEIWALSMAKHNDLGPFNSYEHMYAAIDATSHGDAPWQCFSTSYNGPTTSTSPSWKHAEYEVWYRDPDKVLQNLLDNPDFRGQFDYAPYVELGADGERKWSDFLSGNYSWRHSVSTI